MRRLLFALALAGCRAESVSHISADASCVRAICESTMSTVITETAANADFGTGLTRPDNGEDPSVWSLVLEQMEQELGDRTQALQKLGGLNGSLTRTIHVPLGTSIQNSSSRFTAGIASGIYWNQSSVASAGFLQFAVPPLPVGTKITQVIARWGNSGTAALAIGTPPVIGLYKSTITAGVTFINGVGNGSTVGTQADTTAVLATYQALHNITLTLTETVSADAVYSVAFAGETGANSSTTGVLAGILLTVALP